MARLCEEDKENIKQKPDFLPMVPWYSGYVCYSTSFSVLNSCSLPFVKRYMLCFLCFGDGNVLQNISWPIQDCFWPRGVNKCLSTSFWPAKIAGIILDYTRLFLVSSDVLSISNTLVSCGGNRRSLLLLIRENILSTWRWWSNDIFHLPLSLIPRQQIIIVFKMKT